MGLIQYSFDNHHSPIDRHLANPIILHFRMPSFDCCCNPRDCHSKFRRKIRLILLLGLLCIDCLHQQLYQTLFWLFGQDVRRRGDGLFGLGGLFGLLWRFGTTISLYDLSSISLFEDSAGLKKNSWFRLTRPSFWIR